MRFEGKTAIVTGASIGIGRATAEQLAKNGADVVLVDIKEEGLIEVKNALASTGRRILSYTCDVADEQRVRFVVRDAVEKLGKIDILVNNAGIWRHSMPFAETDSDMWKTFIGVNILGTLHFSHEVLPSMLSRGWGRIINIGSVAGVYGNANMAVYSMTKGAVISFTRALAKEVAGRGITVNCVSPGSVSNVQDVIEASELSFMGRTGTHTENANLICFLASDDAAYISGQNYQIDGCRRKM